MYAFGAVLFFFFCCLHVGYQWSSHWSYCQNARNWRQCFLLWMKLQHFCFLWFYRNVTLCEYAVSKLIRFAKMFHVKCLLWFCHLCTLIFLEFSLCRISILYSEQTKEVGTVKVDQTMEVLTILRTSWASELYTWKLKRGLNAPSRLSGSL